MSAHITLAQCCLHHPPCIPKDTQQNLFAASPASPRLKPQLLCIATSSPSPPSSHVCAWNLHSKSPSGPGALSIEHSLAGAPRLQVEFHDLRTEEVGKEGYRVRVAKQATVEELLEEVRKAVDEPAGDGPLRLLEVRDCRIHQVSPCRAPPHPQFLSRQDTCLNLFLARIQASGSYGRAVPFLCCASACHMKASRLPDLTPDISSIGIMQIPCPQSASTSCKDRCRYGYTSPAASAHLKTHSQ